MLSAFSAHVCELLLQEGRVVRFQSIQLAGGGGGGCCPLSADSISEVSALSADPIILSVGGGCCPLSVRMYVGFYYKGGGGAPFSPKRGGGGGNGSLWGYPCYLILLVPGHRDPIFPPVI